MIASPHSYSFDISYCLEIVLPLATFSSYGPSLFSSLSWAYLQGSWLLTRKLMLQGLFTRYTGNLLNVTLHTFYWSYQVTGPTEDLWGEKQTLLLDSGNGRHAHGWKKLSRPIFTTIYHNSQPSFKLPKSSKTTRHSSNYRISFKDQYLMIYTRSAEKAMAPHSSTLAWKIPWTEEPGRLQSMVVMKSWTWLSDFTFTFHFHALEKEMATHSSILAWIIPGMGELGGLPSIGSHRVRHNWSDLAAAAAAYQTWMSYSGMGSFDLETSQFSRRRGYEEEERLRRLNIMNSLSLNFFIFNTILPSFNVAGIPWVKYYLLYLLKRMNLQYFVGWVRYIYSHPTIQSNEELRKIQDSS